MRTPSAAVVVLCVACGEPQEPVGTGTAQSATETSSTDAPNTSTSTSSAGPSTTAAETTTSDASSRGDEETGDPATDDSGSTGSSDCAPAPETNPQWLAAYLDEAVARMTGEMELSPGVTLSERSTPANRAATADWLDAEFTALGLEVQRHAYSAQGTNIAGRLAATEPGGRTLVVGAHFD
ncbi:MAG: hypothetical protein KUG77_29855, partial [Nannocystaceae bacterium]|nr:hypothetical protein [Nannocystaceae bacterium]